jgi:hypothetical protein
MKASGVSPNSGQEVELEIQDPGCDFFKELATLDLSDQKIKQMIDNLNVSADTKSLLYKLSKTTITIGKNVARIGRKIIDVVCYTAREFPMATFGVIFGGIVGTLISSIPILGQILGPIVTPILMALGFTSGAFLDFQDKMLERKIAKHVETFAPLAKEQ